ncbi:MAG: hypothetical protein PHV02_08720 [Rhodocyclaceae bacterium]|nr:hypothetical protein [Rhodocyclaceae bacterium]
MINRLMKIVGWLIFWFAHVVICVATLFALWGFGVSASDVAEALRHTMQSGTLTIASTVGFSVIGALAGYWRLARWFGQKVIGGWLTRYLTQDMQP